MLTNIPEEISRAEEHYHRIASWISYIEDAVTPKAFKKKCPIVMMNEFDPNVKGDRIDKLLTYTPYVYPDVYHWSEAYFLWLASVNRFAQGFLSTNIDGSADADLNDSLLAISIVAVRYRYLSNLKPGIKKYRTVNELPEHSRDFLLQRPEFWRYSHKTEQAHELDVRITVGLLDHELQKGTELDVAIKKSILNTAV